jgi:hypothetical protein
MKQHYRKHTNKRGTSGKRGCGLINTLINKLPIELHIPGYRYCGPGTKLEKRISRGDPGVNPLDEACKEHDISYSKFKDLETRHKADKVLAQKALNRLKASDAGIGEKLAAASVTGIMKAKTALGFGLRRHRKRRLKRRQTKNIMGRGLRKVKHNGISFNEAVKRARQQISGKKFNNLNNIIKSTLAHVKKQKIIYPKRRIIPIPKTGGFLPLIPLFAGLSALGALGGGAAGIAKAVNDAKAATAKLEEAKRHNKAMEQIVIGKGLYLKPYKQGCGLYLKPYSKNC